MNIYLDNNATTKPCRRVIESIADTLDNYFANPSSSYDLGVKSKSLIDSARKNIAESIGAKSSEIVFVSSGTEANNLAIKGYCLKNRTSKKNHIVCSAIEHPSVLASFLDLEKEGFEVTLIDTDREGRIKLEELRRVVSDRTLFVSIAHSNNEIGTVQDLRGIKAVIEDLGDGAVLHSDMVQSYRKMNTNVEDLGVELASFSGHKIHAPKGIGFLYVKDGLELKTLLSGGGQENGVRNGTESLSLIKALETAVSIYTELDRAKIVNLKDYLVGKLSKNSGFKMLGSIKYGNPSNVCFALRGYEAEPIVKMLAAKKIYVSTRSACSSSSTSVSHVLSQIDPGPEYIHGAIRVGISKFTTYEEIDTLVFELEMYLEKFQPYLIDTILLSEGELS